MAISAQTRLAAVIGDPVRHSMSPAIHNAAFEALGIDGVYVALPVAAGHAGEAVAAMRLFDWYGLSVTMPHKADALASADTATSTAQRLGAANCLFWSDGLIAADSTDGEGFVRGLASDLGVEPAGVHCAIVGAGGAAKAVAASMADGGAARVTVVNRSADKATASAALAGAIGVVGEMADLAHADVVVNATPLGMASTAHSEAVPFDVDLVRDDAVIADLIYHPRETALLANARSKGLRCQNGLPMLVHQAVVAFEHWTGAEAPVEAMTAAVESSLADRA